MHVPLVYFFKALFRKRKGKGTLQGPHLLTGEHNMLDCSFLSRVTSLTPQEGKKNKGLGDIAIQCIKQQLLNIWLQLCSWGADTYFGKIPGQPSASCDLISRVTAPPHGPQSQRVGKWESWMHGVTRVH